MACLRTTFLLASVLASGTKGVTEELECIEGECEQGSHEKGISLLSVRTSWPPEGESTQKTSFNLEAESAQETSYSIARHFAEMAKTMSEENVTVELLRSFRVCGQCKEFKRFGEAGDGGYLICMDGLKKSKTRAGYSFGVAKGDKWSQDVTEAFGVTVNQFDCTVDTVDGGRTRCSDCNFFKKCIVSADGKNPVPEHEGEGWSLKEALEETKQADAPDGSLLLKMDIEGSEWPFYASEHADSLKKFGQILVEFHHLDSEKDHPMYLKAIQNLLGAGFQIVHLHGNNWGGMYETMSDSGTLRIPDFLEVTFVHGGARPHGCLPDAVLDPLDNRNKLRVNDLPTAHLA